MNKTLLFLPALSVLTIGGSAHALVESFSFNGLNLAVPDGNPAGLANSQTIVSGIASIESVVLTLNISGTFNGDLYGYVTHASGFTVLLNRTGKSASSGFGYNDDGFSVTFDDAAAGDIHTYQPAGTPGIGSPVTGLWQPDGRNVDPDLVTDLSARGAMLSSFNTGVAGGDWTLFLADMSTGDAHMLQSWSMTITGIPEPDAVVLATAAGLLATMRRRRR